MEFQFKRNSQIQINLFIQPENKIWKHTTQKY